MTETISKDEHYRRVNELLGHNNAQLEENRAQRRLIKAHKLAIELALSDLGEEGINDGSACTWLEQALALEPLTNDLIHAKAAELAERIVRGLREDLDEAHVRHETHILTDTILTWLKDEHIA